MRGWEYYSAAFAIIKDEQWKILFQKRANTGFRDGFYQLPSGHLEWEESMIACIIREVKEEINLDVAEKDCRVVHMSHSVNPWERTYFNIYIEISTYSWELKNMETNKCSELRFIDRDEIRTSELCAYDNYILEKIEAWEPFSDRIL